MLTESVVNGGGVSDYFWVDPVGKGWVFFNVGRGKNKWEPYGQTAVPATSRKREDIHMARLTKTGRADYIVVDKKIGQSFWWQNFGEDRGFGWSARGEFATGPKNTIETKFGWKFNARNVRFAE